MLKFVIIAIIQSLFLTVGHVFTKLGLTQLPSFEWSCAFFKNVLLCWPLAACGAAFGIAGGLWIYMLRNFDFSIAYPITSISYIFGMIAAALIFNEPISASRWIGVFFIIAGVFFILKQ